MARLRNSRGAFSVVEVLLAAAVFALLATTLAGAYFYGWESSLFAGNLARATLLAEEGLEAARAIRSGSFADLADGTYGLALVNGRWIFSGSEDTDDIFTRQIVVASPDADHRAVTATVSWLENERRPASVMLATVLTSWSTP